MKLLGSFMVPHPPLIVEEIGKERINDIDNSIVNNNKNFDTRYNIYCLFVNLTSKFIKIINTIPYIKI